MNPSARKTILCAILLAAAMGAVFGRSLWYPFLIWDDQQHITQNHAVNPPSVDGLKEIWRRPYFGLYVPLSYTFFSAESSIARRPLDSGVGSRPNPAVFHAGCVLLHIGCVLLVFFLLRKLFKHDLAAMAGAMLFGLHPLQVESVAWISETRGLLCSLFSLLAIYSYLPAEPSRENWKRYALATLCFVAALLSKPAAVVVPLLVLLLDWGILRHSFKRTLLFMSPWFAISLAFVVLTKVQQPVLDATPIWARPLIAGDVLAFYLNKLFAPVFLCSDYGRTPAVAMSGWTFYIAWLLPVGLVAILACVPNRRLWLIAAGLFVVWLLPVLGFVPFSFQRISTVADRYVYLAMLGPALALGWFLSRPRSQAASAIVVAVLCVLAGLSVYQVSHWRNNDSLLAHTLSINPSSLTGQQLSGHLLALEGNHAEAVKLYRKALKQHPNQDALYLNLVVSLSASGHDDEALEAAERGVAAVPGSAVLRCKLGELLADRGRTEEAVEHLTAALELPGNRAAAHFALARLASKQGENEKAISHYRSAIREDPFFVLAYVNLGAALEKKGRLGEAAECYWAALDIEPSLPSAHFNLGNVALQQGGVDRAIGHYKEALRLREDYISAHANLAYALTQKGVFDEAAEHYRTVLRLAPAESPTARQAAAALERLGNPNPR